MKDGSHKYNSNLVKTPRLLGDFNKLIEEMRWRSPSFHLIGIYPRWHVHCIKRPGFITYLTLWGKMAPDVEAMT
jgi:hypothetical protein